MGDLIQFSPKPNQKADRAFWKGEAASNYSDVPVGQAQIGQAFKAEDTAPCEMNPGYVAPDEDCA